MESLKAIITKYREQLAYLFFGGVTTAVNIGAYALLHTALHMHSDLANAIAWAVSVAAAYFTNRRWVFMSHSRGRAMLREMAAFVGGRVLTGLMDAGIMHVAVERIGPRLIPAGLRSLWDIGVKVASNVLVILLNYVFSRKFIFKNRPEGGSS